MFISLCIFKYFCINFSKIQEQLKFMQKQLEILHRKNIKIFVYWFNNFNKKLKIDLPLKIKEKMRVV